MSNLRHDARVDRERLGELVEVRREEDEGLSVRTNEDKTHPRFDELLGDGLAETDAFDRCGTAAELESVRVCCSN